MIDEQTDESLSALIDGELPVAQAQRLLDRVLADDALRERWREHHLTRAALTPAQSIVLTDDELASRVSAALDAQEPPIALRSNVSARGTRRVGLAIAASVVVISALVVFGITGQEETISKTAPIAAVNPQSPSPESATPIVAATQPAVVPVRETALAATNVDTGSGSGNEISSSALTRMTWNDARPAVEARLNSYLLDHNEYLADGVRGMLPYARVVGYDARN